MLLVTFELHVNVVLVRQSMAVCMRASCDRDLLFVFRSFSSVSCSDCLAWLLRQPCLEMNL